MVIRRSKWFLVFVMLLTVLNSAAFAQEGEQMTHVVQKGENLYRIALRYGVDLNELAVANDIENTRRIYEWQILVIPGLTVPDDSETVFNPLIAGTPVVHVVQRGDNLTRIANTYNITVEQIMMTNSIGSANSIFSGQELYIWTPETVDQEVVDTVSDENVVEDVAVEVAVVEIPAYDTTVTHVVQRGEYLSQIARAYGVSWVVLAQMNDLADPSHVYAGQSLIIPVLNGDGGIVDMGIIADNSGKQIVVDLSDSRIYAYENGVLVRNVLVSTGRSETPTVQGNFTVERRVRAQTMTGPGYSLPNVEWVQYFHQAYAIHGTYWHSNWGYPMSHGCVNLPNDEAYWFWEFSTVGTPVRVQW
jgi:LysM repeat protein